ncbi:hypothetical protein [Kordiimonas laminariae]|uniref:hypothetical protein n=1 Tax=Kordiimonas laminariae TaxID=2917717 RepID=UPI001FF12769|nr:hypothetical protein [Kordiimonas laminariae]MCK0069194.1 hypothetical protein [Kordiimonas laminariae]
MNNHYKIYVLKDDGEKVCLGSMAGKHITYNRYSEGMLIAAGKLWNTSVENQVFLKFVTQFHDTIPLRFESSENIFEGNFTFSNFDAELSIVIFGSEGPVYETEQTAEDFDEDDIGIHRKSRAEGSLELSH